MRSLLALLILGACDGGTTSGASCDDLSTELEAEVARVTTCDVDVDCGQAVTATSCQPECDMVARNDVDASVLEGLVAEAADASCPLPFERPCDCPAPVGAVCTDAGTCEWDWGDWTPPR